MGKKSIWKNGLRKPPEKKLKVFVPKFAFLSVGVILGCIMFFNVFFVIVPNGKNITSSALNKEKFDLSLSISAKTRSVHNNIITFLLTNPPTYN